MKTCIAKWLFCLPSVLALTACEAGEIVGAPDEEAFQYAAALDCAEGESVQGLDVSKYQPVIDWEKVRDSGVEFVFIRAAYGTTVDPYFAKHWQGAKNAGLLVGAYQYVRLGQDVDDQVDTLLATVGPLGQDDLPLVLDVEIGFNEGYAPAAWRAFIRRWTDRVEAESGKRPIIYTGGPFWNTYVKDAGYGAYPLWEPRYSSTACPVPPTGWSRWSFWQYTDSAKTPGIAGGSDRNVFNGSIDELLELARGGATPPPPPPPPPPPMDVYYRVCNASWLNQRSGPGTSFAVLRALPKGARVKALASDSGWIKGDWSGKVGWSKATYLCAE